MLAFPLTIVMQCLTMPLFQGRFKPRTATLIGGLMVAAGVYLA